MVDVSSSSESCLPQSSYSLSSWCSNLFDVLSENGSNDAVLSKEGRRGSVNEDTEFRVYRRRWFLLLIVALVNYTNATMWICFAPVAYDTAQYFDVSVFLVNMLSVIFLAMFIPFSFVGIYVCEAYGLRSLIVSSAAVNMVGGLLRVAALYTCDQGSTAQYVVLFAGQTIAAIAQALILIQPTKLAAYWFGPNERTLANSLGTSANQFGLMLANLVTPFILDSSPDRGIEYMLLLWSLPTVIPMLFCVVFIKTKSYPPCPPSQSAVTPSLDFKASMKEVLKSPPFWVLMLSFGSGIAAFSALISLLQQILCVYGYSNEFSGIACTVCIGFGCVGCGVFGTLADKTKKYDQIFKVCYLLACLGSIAFSWASCDFDMDAYILISMGWFGFFGLVLFPLALELSVECTYPASESASSGIIISAGQIIGAIMLVGLPLFGQKLTEEQEARKQCAKDVTPSNLWISSFVLSGYLCFIAIFTVLFFRSPDKRIQAEDQSLSFTSPFPSPPPHRPNPGTYDVSMG